MKIILKNVFYIIAVAIITLVLDTITDLLFGRPFGIVIVFACIGVYFAFTYFYNLRILSQDRIAKLEFSEPKTPIPSKLRAYHNEIISLGFNLAGECSTPRPIPFPSARRTIWLYLNLERTIVVWLHDLPRIDFDSYLPDGFNVSTQYPKGNNLESTMVDFNIVTTSITTAYDYHLHHCDMVKAEHGEPSVIENWEILKQRQYQPLTELREHVKQSTFAGLWGGIGQLAVFFGLIGLGYAYMEILVPLVLKSEPVQPTVRIACAIMGIVILSAPIGWAGWMLWQVIRNEISSANTVEARKAKKRHTN